MQIHAGLGYPMGMELIFEVRDAEEGGYCARALGHGIFTEAETWDKLRANVLETIGPFRRRPGAPEACTTALCKGRVDPA